MSSNYNEEIKIKNTLLLRNKLKGLPPFMEEFFRGIADTTSPRTRIGYAYDLTLFFDFLSQDIEKFGHKSPLSFTLNDLATIDADDIERFMAYLSYYIKTVNGQTVNIQNEEQGKSRKLAAIRSLLSYFYKKGKIPSNPGELVDFPKLHNKAIVRLEVNEVAKLLDEVEKGEKLTDQQKIYHNITRIRDLAIITLLLGTGMRVSECVGINISHIDFNSGGVKITRKGGDEAIIYFGEEVEQALSDYLDERELLQPLKGHEDALFLSLQSRRLTVRAIQNLVKKYAKLVAPLKKITPHKLRSTYGTTLYQETGDIYLVADVLGHTDVNTTRKHYAHMAEERRKLAAHSVRLRN